MEVMSPQTLWKEYDRKSLPLNVYVVSRKIEDGIITERLYFSGERTGLGVTRIFAKLCMPESFEKLPAVIIMNELNQGVDDCDTSAAARAGYAALTVDYAGRCDSRERFTIYPPELKAANYFDDGTTLSATPENPKNTCWYIWETVMLRAVTFVENDERLSGEIALVGVGAGGSQVFKTAALENLKCGVTLFSTHVSASPGSDGYINFRACIDNRGYAPLSRFPVLSQVSSNDPENFIDRVSEMCLSAPDNYYLSVSERTVKSLRPRQIENVRLWLSQYMKMGLPMFVRPPVISARQSDKSLYYEIKADVRLPLSKVELFVAYEVQQSAYRNWRKLKPIMAGEGDYLAKVPVYDVSAPVYAFAGVSYAGGFYFSTPMLSKIPASLGVESETLIKSRMLYDSENGADDFVTPQGGDDDVVMAKGSLDIEGVCSLTGELATYKVGDVQFRAERDSLLQLIVCTGAPQEAVFTVKTLEGGGEYLCRRKVEPGDGWAKLTLSAEDFKSREGALRSLEDAVYFSIRSEERLLINSMLWV